MSNITFATIYPHTTESELNIFNKNLTNILPKLYKEKMKNHRMIYELQFSLKENKIQCHVWDLIYDFMLMGKDDKFENLTDDEIDLFIEKEEEKIFNAEIKIDPYLRLAFDFNYNFKNFAQLILISINQKYVGMVFIFFNNYFLLNKKIQINIENLIEYLKNNHRFKIKKVKYEHILRDLLNISIEGIKEVNTPVGFIDILSDTQIIEIKNFNDWKHGLGQLLAYRYYYPNHKSRLHLFNVSKKALKLTEEITKICKTFNVEVTYTFGKPFMLEE